MIKVKRIITLLLVTVFSCMFFLSCGSNTGSAGSENNNSGKEIFTVKFEVCAPEGVRTNIPGEKKIESGETVDEPTVSQVGSGSYYIAGWYEDSEYKTEWDFNIDPVLSDITLYAKWEEKFAVEYYTKASPDEPVYSEMIKNGRKASPADGVFVGHKVSGYYKDPAFTEKFDFSAPITKKTSIYADVSETMYLDARAIKRNFMNRAAPSGAGSIAGDTYIRADGEGGEYAEVNFGYSTAYDPCIIMSNVSIDISKSPVIRITYKNLGSAERIRFFFAVTDAEGKFLGGSGDDNQRMVAYEFKTSEKNMSESGEWAVMDLKISELNEYWRDATYLSRVRLDCWYKSKSPDDLSNIMLIKSIEGVNTIDE